MQSSTFLHLFMYEHRREHKPSTLRREGGNWWFIHLNIYPFLEMGKTLSSSCASLRSARNGYSLGGLYFVFVKGFGYVLLLLPVTIIYGDNVTSQQNWKLKKMFLSAMHLKYLWNQNIFLFRPSFAVSLFSHFFFFQNRKFEIKSCDAVFTRAEYSYGLL